MNAANLYSLSTPQSRYDLLEQGIYAREEGGRVLVQNNRTRGDVDVHNEPCLRDNFTREDLKGKQTPVQTVFVAPPPPSAPEKRTVNGQSVFVCPPPGYNAPDLNLRV